MNYLKRNSAYLQNKVEQLKDLEADIETIAPIIKLDQILKLEESAEQMLRFPVPSIMATISDEEMRSFDDETVEKIRNVGHRLHNATDIVQGTRCNGEEREETQQIAGILNWLSKAIYEAETGKHWTGRGDRLLRDCE